MTEYENTGFKTSNPFLLFIIGLTAGIIAALLPRLMTFLSLQNEVVKVTLFPKGYFIAAGIFALIIATSMVWLNLGKPESTKNLFMAALALPAALSGGLNMTNVTSEGQIQVQAISNDYENFQKQVGDLEKIPTAETLDFDSDDVTENITKEDKNHSALLLNILGPANAYAGDSDEPKKESEADSNPGVSFNVETSQKDHILILEKSNNRQVLETKIELLQLPNVAIKRKGSSYYLITQDKKTKADALIEAIQLKRNFSTHNLKPQLMKVK